MLRSHFGEHLCYTYIFKYLAYIGKSVPVIPKFVTNFPLSSATILKTQLDHQIQAMNQYAVAYLAIFPSRQNVLPDTLTKVWSTAKICIHHFQSDVSWYVVLMLQKLYMVLI